MLKEGIKGTQEVVVSEENTAKTMGSGALYVFATPAMIALMEKTAWESVQPYLEEGSGTVGTLMNVKHVAASPVGMKITCETELVKVDGRALTFTVKAFDEAGLIGEGEHERFVVFNDKFQTKADAKLQIKGRHDPCIVPRAAVVQNTLAAFAVLDLLTVRYGTLGQK